MSGCSEAHPRVLISYSHDSPTHRQRVLELGNRLVEEGVDCHLDRYVQFPKQGWPRWMLHELEEADFVLVVCTETYHRRALGHEDAGRGLGATWEGLVITQELYMAGGTNTKFVPVIFEMADAQYVPVFLQGYSYYNVGTQEGYDDLYSLLTNQPLVVRPALGARREIGSPSSAMPHALGAAAGVQRSGPLPPAAAPAAPPEAQDTRIMVLLQPANGNMTYFLRAERIDEEADESVLVLTPTSGRESAALQSLRGPYSSEVLIAHGLIAYKAVVESLVRSQSGKSEHWTMRVRRQDRLQRGYGLGVTFNGISTHDQAEMRARRILLNERSQARTGREFFQDTFLEHYISGEEYGIRIACSPFPELYRQLGNQPTEYLEAARLTAVLMLQLTDVVEHIFRFDLALTGIEELSVNFEGQRRQEFTNVPAKLIKIQGICRLGADFC